jgi:signal transduction histidine kinase
VRNAAARVSAAARRPAGLAFKLLATVFAIVVAVVMVQALVGSVSTDRANEAEERNALLAAWRAYRNEVGVLEREAVAMALSVADRPDVRTMVAQRDQPGLSAALTPLFVTLRDRYYIAQFSVHDGDGSVLLRLHEPGRSGDAVTGYRRTSASVMKSGVPAGGAELGPDGLGIRGVAPVFQDDRFVGMVEIGLDHDTAFVVDMRARTGLDYRIWLTYEAAVRVGLLPRGTELPPPIPEVFFYTSTTSDALELPAEVYKAALAGGEEAVIRFGNTRGQDLAILLGPLVGFDRRVLGLLEIVASRSDALAKQHSTQLATALMATLLGVLALALEWLAIDRLVLRSLRALADAAHRRLAGDLGARATVSSSDELGEVATAFNRMTDELGEYICGLEEQVELARRAEREATAEIEERKRVEAARDASEATNHAILEATPDAILRFDREGRFMDFVPGKDFRGEQPGDPGVLPAELGARLEARVREVQDSGRMDMFVYTREAAGGPRNYEARIVSAGAYGSLGIVRDITQRVRMEQETQRLQAQLLQAHKMESIGRLAGGVAHDFNNLLTPILGYADLLAAPHADTSGDRQMAEEILAAGRRAQDLVAQLLAFGRKQVLSMVVCDLNRILAGFETILRRTIRENIEIRFRHDPCLWPVCADRTRVEQVLMNLAVNAQDAMPCGGLLSIETGNAAVDGKSVGANTDLRVGEYAVISVSDNGVGMTPDVVSHMFEPFYTTKPQGTGTGLGLATVFGIVKQHRGAVSVYSEPGSGSTFRVYLPRAQGLPVAEAATERVVAPPGPGRTVLLVEDTESVRRMIATALGRKGYRVLVADGAEAAFRILDGHREAVDLLLSDVIMPRMNGPELFRSLSSRLPGLKVLYMSGYADTIISTQGVLTGGACFIQKPFTLDALLAKLAGVLG